MRQPRDQEPFTSTVAVIGAGLMGSGVAQVAAQAGHEVRLRDVGKEQLDRGVRSITESVDRFVAKGKLSREDADAALARITVTTDLEEAAASADIVVEAVFEHIDVKHEVFAVLDEVCRPDAVLATNTSAIPITSVAAVTRRPESVIGTHFFSPVPMMRLVELVRGYKTSDETLATATAFAESVGKTCVVVNRDKALAMEAARLVESGVISAEDLDVACRLGFGHAMGPLETSDLTGVDIMVYAARNIYGETQDSKFLPPESMLRMVAAGDLGRKTGRGFYRYGG